MGERAGVRLKEMGQYADGMVLRALQNANLWPAKLNGITIPGERAL